MSGPNILLIVFDTARADALEPYGARPGASPTVAQLAAGGRVAPQAFATSCWTVPSHASMFTGLLPRTAGLGSTNAPTPQGFQTTMRASLDRMLPAVLSRHGYVSSGVSANLWVSPDSGFDTGFDQFRYVRSQRKATFGDTSWKGQLKWALEAVRARADDGATEVEALVDAWIRGRDRSRPFFTFVNLVECHSPYLPPKPYAPSGLLARVRAGLDAQRYQTFAAFTRNSLPGGFDVDEDALWRMQQLYARAVLLMDDWLARILQCLDDHGVLDDTLVLLTSDHGENFGDGCLLGHTFSLDDRLIRIPMIAAGPGSPTFSGLTSLADVPAMLCQAAEVRDHPYRSRSDTGVAVAQLDPPCVPDDPTAPRAIAELGLGDDALARLLTRFACATDGRHKLVRENEVELFFDLESDVLEEHPVEPPASPVVHRLRAALDEAAAAEAQSVNRRSGAAEPSDDLKARMELLGYL